MNDHPWVEIKETAKIEQALRIRGLHFFLCQEWGSASPHHREKIRTHLQSHTRSPSSVLDLQQIPVIDGASVSISHSRNLGGYAISSANERIGFDLEETARVQASAVKRIARMNREMSQAPSPAQLWVAKESSFKAMSINPKVTKISDLEVFDWRVAGEHSTFHGRVILEPTTCVRGVSWQSGGFSFALSVLLQKNN